MVIETREPYSIDREQIAQMVAAHLSGFKDAKADISDYVLADAFIASIDKSVEVDSPAQELIKKTSYLASMVFDGTDRCGEAIIVWLRSCNQDAKWMGSAISFAPLWGSGLLRKGQELVRTIGNEFYIREE